jgi:hypothetical protein
MESCAEAGTLALGCDTASHIRKRVGAPVQAEAPLMPFFRGKSALEDVVPHVVSET